MDTDTEKLLRVFNSCTTEQHFDVALRYANLFLKAMPIRRDYLVGYILLSRYVERIIGYTQGRLNVDI